MQWIALDNDRPITAAEALKQKRYLCPECHLPIRLRSGPHRQAHFYHLRGTLKCSQHRKTEEHLGLQLALAASIPRGEAKMERPFPEINRIADIAWESQKIVIEIQCSPMSLQEAEQRCRDYRSAGWELLWILSDRKFNKRKLSAAEAYLRLQTCYYSHWAERKIYDQWEVLKGFLRIYKGPKVQINPLLIQAHNAQDAAAFALPTSLKRRWDNWKLRASGDILSRIHAEEPYWAKTVIELEEDHREKPVQRLPWLTLFRQCYLQMLNKFLLCLALKTPLVLPTDRGQNKNK